jgi:hypothetical protein
VYAINVLVGRKSFGGGKRIVKVGKKSSAGEKKTV